MVSANDLAAENLFSSNGNHRLSLFTYSCDWLFAVGTSVELLCIMSTLQLIYILTLLLYFVVLLYNYVLLLVLLLSLLLVTDLIICIFAWCGLLLEMQRCQ